MRIDFESSGGYANLPLSLRVESDDLAPDVAREIEDLVVEAGFFDLRQSQLEAAGVGPPDVLSYRLTLSQAGRGNTIACNDVTAPESLRPLLGRLRVLALERRQGQSR